MSSYLGIIMRLTYLIEKVRCLATSAIPLCYKPIIFKAWFLVAIEANKIVLAEG